MFTYLVKKTKGLAFELLTKEIIEEYKTAEGYFVLELFQIVYSINDLKWSIFVTNIKEVELKHRFQPYTL